MFAIVICNYTRNKETDFKAQSHTEGWGYELLCQGTEKIISQAQTAQPFSHLLDGSISQKNMVPN